MYRNKLGFIIKDDFYPITGKGHDGTAMEIISSHGWLSEYHNYNRSDPKDFLIFKKGAIQLGSSRISNQIIYSSLKHSRRDIEKIQKKYDLHMYKIIAY